MLQYNINLYLSATDTEDEVKQIKIRKTRMFIYWQHNKNIILAAVGLFIVSMTALLFFLTENVPRQEDLKANVVDSVTLKSDMEEEKNFRTAMESSEGPFIVVEPDGMIDFLSWDYETMTGYTKPDLKEQLFFSIVHPEDLPKVISAFGSVIATEKTSKMVGPFRVRDANGEYHLHMATIYPVKNQEKVEKLIFSSVDITQDVRKNETWQEEEPEEVEKEAVRVEPQPEAAPVKADQNIELMKEEPVVEESLVEEPRVEEAPKEEELKVAEEPQVAEEKPQLTEEPVKADQNIELIKEEVQSQEKAIPDTKTHKGGNSDNEKQPSKGKKIRDEQSNGEKRLVVEKLAMLFMPFLPDRPRLLSWVPYFLPPM